MGHGRHGNDLMVDFTNSIHCTSRVHCVTCRADAKWRTDLGAPDICPSGATDGIRILVGPGSELKRVLKWFGIAAQPNCKCNARAREMDLKGVAWCEENTDTIVGWLKEEARNRNLPFLEPVGRRLVKFAIRNARKNLRSDGPANKPKQKEK